MIKTVALSAGSDIPRAKNGPWTLTAETFSVVFALSSNPEKMIVSTTYFGKKVRSARQVISIADARSYYSLLRRAGFTLSA